MRRLGVALAVAVVVAISGCAASPAPTSGVGSPDPDDRATYLEHVKTTWSGDIPDAEVLLGYGDEVCRQLVDGEEPEDVDILEDETDAPAADANTRSVVDAATLALCPTALDG